MKTSATLHIFILAVTLSLGFAFSAWAGCTSPTGAEGQLNPDTTNHVLQYCNGTAWTNLGGGGAASGSTGYVQFNNTTGLGGDVGLFWDNTNKRLGIGYASSPAPETKLHITTGIFASPTQVIKFMGSDSVGAGCPIASLGFGTDPYAGGNGSFEFRSSDSCGGTGGYNFLNQNNSTVGFRINPDGKVGIGTTIPSTALHVIGTITATDVVSTSDRRLKKDIEPLSAGALESVQRLIPVRFKWKHTTDVATEGTQMGFIAQDVAKVLPDVVVTARDATGTESIKYNELIALLAKAVQELKADNDNLHRELDALRVPGR